MQCGTEAEIKDREEAQTDRDGWWAGEGGWGWRDGKGASEPLSVLLIPASLDIIISALRHSLDPKKNQQLNYCWRVNRRAPLHTSRRAVQFTYACCM